MVDTSDTDTLEAKTRSAYRAKLRAKRDKRTGASGVDQQVGQMLEQLGVTDEATKEKVLKSAAAGKMNTVQSVLMEAVMNQAQNTDLLSSTEVPPSSTESSGQQTAAEESSDEEAPPVGDAASGPVDESSDEEAPPAASDAVCPEDDPSPARPRCHDARRRVAKPRPKRRRPRPRR